MDPRRDRQSDGTQGWLPWIALGLLVATSSVLHLPIPTLRGTPHQATPTPSPTRTASPSPTPTSYRVADLGVSIEDSRDPVRVGERFRYRIRTDNFGPAAAPNGLLTADLTDRRLRFTGVYSLTGIPNGTCSLVHEQAARCSFLAIMGQVVGLEVAVDGPPSIDRSTGLCAELSFSSAGGGRDPNPINDRACERTQVLEALTPERWWVHLPTLGR